MQSKVKNLVLVGGGHSHAIALKLFAQRPLAEVKITLISPNAYTAYSGMLPGYIAGFYDYQACHINLPNLCKFAQAQLILDQVIDLDLNNQRAICKSGREINFNLISLDIGSTPTLPNGDYSAGVVIPAKPVPEFLEGWHHLLQQVKAKLTQPLVISIIGGGVGGVELCLNIQRALQQIIKAKLEIHLFHRDSELLNNSHSNWIRQRLKEILQQRGVQLHLNEQVKSVEQFTIECESGLKVDCDRIICVTNATAANWLTNTGLQLSTQGFIQVQNTLQSVSHPHIFATGDIAEIANHSHPKAGVFAVRQGYPLFENLCNFCLDRPLKFYFPQKHYLSLIGTANYSALASWHGLVWESPLLWQWKDYIDRKFMSQFQNLDAKPIIKKS